MRKPALARRSLLALALALALALTADAALAACKVSKLAELPVTLLGRRAIVDAKFGTHDARFIVDSGAFYSTLSRASAAEFGLSSAPAPASFRLRGINGTASADVATAKSFALAGIPLDKTTFIVGGSDTGTAGLLGQNILGLGDVEYDLPHSAVRLMRSEGCSNTALAYWAEGKPFSAIPLERGDGGPWKPHTTGTVVVNGVKLRSVFDSGAQTSVMTLAAAKRAGVTPTSPGVVAIGTGSGLGSKQVATWLAPFDKIDLGGEVVPHPKFRDADMLIGFDFFLTHRIFVSNATHMLYMTYEGGTVFGLTPTGAKTATGEKLDLTDKTAEPTDAEGFSRRSTVLLSNRKFAEGLADLDRAVAMAPNEGRYVFLRAQGRLANGQPLLAAADLDHVATLMPDNADVRLTRARLRLMSRDPAGAAEDAAVADARLPPGSDRRLQLAGLFDNLDNPESAIANLDAWLRMHGEDVNRATAFNGRCWARALLNRELDRALSDCNTALRLRPGSAAVFDSRALVQLRLGKLDRALADYDAAIAMAPRNAWTLYLRGIALARAGKADAAAADRKAALAINPGVAQRATRYGLN